MTIERTLMKRFMKENLNFKIFMDPLTMKNINISISLKKLLMKGKIKSTEPKLEQGHYLEE